MLTKLDYWEDKMTGLIQKPIDDFIKRHKLRSINTTSPHYNEIGIEHMEQLKQQIIDDILFAFKHNEINNTIDVIKLLIGKE
jgi:hypothetical protein